MTKQFKSTLALALLIGILVPTTSFADDYIVKEPPSLSKNYIHPLEKNPNGQIKCTKFSRH